MKERDLIPSGNRESKPSDVWPWNVTNTPSPEVKSQGGRKETMLTELLLKAGCLRLEWRGGRDCFGSPELGQDLTSCHGKQRSGPKGVLGERLGV